MATTIDYASDCGGEASDYCLEATTMADETMNLKIGLESASNYRLCPLKQGIGMDDFRKCDGPRCAWWDADKSRCAVLSLARNK